jgi:porin
MIRESCAWAVASSILLTNSVQPAERVAAEILPITDSSRNPLVESSSESEHLTGDWGGWRNQLVERGLHFQAGYIGETFGNVSGGLRRGAIYEGMAEAAFEIELARLLQTWRGATFRASGLFPHGRSASRELTGDVQTLSNIDAYDSVAL